MNASDAPAPASIAMRDAPRSKPKTPRLDTSPSALGLVSPRFVMLIHISHGIECGTAHVYGHVAVTLAADARHASRKSTTGGQFSPHIRSPRTPYLDNIHTPIANFRTNGR